MHFSEKAILLFLFIGSSLCQNLWHSNFMGISGKPRNEFILRNVSMDEKFSLNLTVDYWRSLNLRYSSFAAGISNESIVILNVSKTENPNDFNITSRSREMNARFKDAVLANVPFENETESRIFLVGVSQNEQLFWFDVHTLEVYWIWNLGYNVDHIQLGFNPLRNRKQLFLASKNTMYIYDFDLGKRQHWLTENLEMSNQIGAFDMIQFQNRFYLLVPQESLGELHIFRYVGNHFQTFRNISAAGIEQVVAFQINYKSFFAVVGLEAGIYQFDQRNRVRLEVITNSHLEGIKYWLPIKINNMRKNFILFGQRVLHHGSLKSLVSETFIYNGENFEEHDDIPCRIFGEEFNTLNCLSNTQESAGMEGAAAISIGNNLGLLLAKRNSHHLFKVNFEVRDKESPIREKMREVKELRNHLQKLLDDRLKNETASSVVTEKPIKKTSQRESLETSASYRNNKTIKVEYQRKAPIIGARNKLNLTEKIDVVLERLQQLNEKIEKVKDMERSGNFKKLILRGKTRVENVKVENVNTEALNGDPVAEILKDVVRKDKNETVRGTKTFTDLDVKNLFFDTINGIKSEDMMFRGSEDVILNGNVFFEKPVAVLKNIQTDSINGMPSSSIINIGEHIDGELSFETLKVENIEVEGRDGLLEEDSSENGVVDHITGQGAVLQFPNNITVGRVNGVDFEKFLAQLCLVNIPNHISGTVIINGDVIFESPSSADYVNNLKFPEEFISTRDSGTISIPGKKVFKNTVTTKMLTTNKNFINELRSEDYFTLSTPQEIFGKATFPNLEITKKFMHDGKTIGDQLNNLLPNPTLGNSFNISSNVNFEILEVTGSVIVENMDGLNYGRILEDIIYKDEESSIINSIKEFAEGLTITNNLEITSNSVNKITLDQIVTEDTPQSLNIPQLNGNVSIESMEVKQLINGINVTKLDQELVKSSGEQFISSFLVFEGDIEAENLEVREKLNEIPVENFLTITGDRIINKKPIFKELQVENLSVTKNLEGFFVEMDLANFTKTRLTYSTPQNITENVSLRNSKVEKIDCREDSTLCQVVLNKKEMEDEIISNISSGNILVKELVVNEDFNVEHLNGMPLNQEQELKKKSSILDGNVYFKNLRVTKLSDVPIKELLEDAVFKTETDIEVKGLKTFKNGFTVEKLIEAEKLNDVPVENLLTKQGDQIIEAPVQIYGNVTFRNDIHVAETINEVSIEEVKDYFEYKDDIFLIKGDLTFNRLMYINDFDVLGRINNKSFDNIFKNIVYLNEKIKLSDDIEFRGSVKVDGNLAIKNNLNGISLSQTNENIVYLNKIDDNNIESQVEFTDDNVFAHHLLIETNLATKWMRGLDLEAFRRNAIFLNKGFLEGTYHFYNITLHDNLFTKFINKVNMSETIPLGSDQDINHLSFDNIVFINSVTVEDSVNGFNFPKEYANTMLSNEDQTIHSDIYLKNKTLIRHKFEVGGLLNGNPIHQIVTTDTNQTLTATYLFSQKTVLESDMHVTGFVNSINMSAWEGGALKVSSREPQEISAPWYFTKNLTFEDSLECPHGISGFDVEEQLNLMHNRKENTKNMHLQYEKDYKSICKDIHSLNKEFKKQTYKFESLEEMQNIEYNYIIGKTHFFNYDKPSLLLNGIGKCTVDIYHLEDEVFVKSFQFEMGEIDQIISVRDDASIFFVVKAKSNSKCDSEGTLVWQYKNATMKKVQNIENQQIIQESLVPLTFYGLNKNGVTEFRIDMSKAIPVEPFRRWKVREENAAFMPRGLSSGLAVRTGRKIIKLLRDEPLIDNDIGFENAAVKGEMKVFDNFVIPGRNNSKIAVVNVGPKSLRKTLLAIVFHEDTVVGRNIDVMKIYEDYSKNKVFQEIFTYNPTSLISLELKNGETLLLILENEEKLQIYRYRGVEGFRRHLSAELPGTHMFKMSFSVSSNGGPVETIAIVRKNMIKVLKPVMTGIPTNENIECP